MRHCPPRLPPCRGISEIDRQRTVAAAAGTGQIGPRPSAGQRWWRRRTGIEPASDAARRSLVLKNGISCDDCPVCVLKSRKLTIATRNKLYQQVVAQMALRTLRSVFAADRETKVLEAVRNGYVDTIDTGTGQDAHRCLVTVQVPQFARLDLARVDPVDCLAHLHAKISQTPEKYQPVQPIIEYPWGDLHYADELDAAAGLDSVKNLLELDGYEFEQLLVKLFQEIPEFDEVRRTRSRADGGIDLVAVNKTPFVGGRVAIQAKRYAPHNTKMKVPNSPGPHSCQIRNLLIPLTITASARIPR
jgi:hypothetical protein